MAKTITTSPGGLADAGVRSALSKLQTASCDFVMQAAGLALKTTSSPLAKSANTIKAFIDGVVVTKAAADMAALAGTIATAKKGIFVFTLAADGTLATRAGSLTAATLAALTYPTIPAGEVIIGFIIVENATGSDFVGGTTALDTASLTVTYVDTPFPWNPNAVTL